MKIDTCIEKKKEGKKRESFGLPQNGRRCSAADAYLRTAIAQKRISVIPFAHVSRILFDKKKAIGVEVLDPVTIRQTQAFSRYNGICNSSSVAKKSRMA